MAVQITSSCHSDEAVRLRRPTTILSMPAKSAHELLQPWTMGYLVLMTYPSIPIYKEGHLPCRPLETKS